MDIVVDFDGTCVTHEYPLVGSDIGAVPVLQALVEKGHNLILSTMRSNKPFTRGDGSIDNSGLDDAVNWFKENGIKLYGIQTHPTQKRWTDSPKAYGQLHIDDAALGCPLIYPENGRPYVDWNTVEVMLQNKGLLPKSSGYKLFLDDERTVSDTHVLNILCNPADAHIYSNPAEWVVVRTYHEFVSHIAKNGLPSVVSFDHDLGDFSGPNKEERTGMDCAKYLVSICLDKPAEFPKWIVHSQNTVGAENIVKYMDNAFKHLYL